MACPDLEGTSKGQMLAAGPVDKGSGVYVAIETVTGKCCLLLAWIEDACCRGQDRLAAQVDVLCPPPDAKAGRPPR